MSHSIDFSIGNDLINGLDDSININDDLLLLPQDVFEQISQPLYSSEDFADVVASELFSSDMRTTATPSGFSPENNSNHQELSNIVSEAVAAPANIQSNLDGLKIIAEPYYRIKLRYRSDYEKNESRLGVLKNRTKDSNYQGPAIRISSNYLNPNGEFFIRVSLVVEIDYNNTKLHYFHPYELENPVNGQLNDRLNNSVLFVIQDEDCTTGIKSFSSLRIVKKRAADLKLYGNLRVFDCEKNQNSQNNYLPQLSSVKDTITKYNLDKCQLAFTIARQTTNDNNESVLYIYPDTTVYSQEMIEGIGIESEIDNESQLSNEMPILSPTTCKVYKYAPKSGFDQSNEDMLILLTSKLEPKKYGDLKITFQCDTSEGHWSQSVTDLDIKDRTVSFKTPIFPYSFDNIMPVDVILQQDNRTVGEIKYFYLSTLNSCSKCQSIGVGIQTNTTPNVRNKRRARLVAQMHDGNVTDRYSEQGFIAHMDDQNDGVVPISNDSPTFQQSLSVPVQESSLLLMSSSSVTTSSTASLPPIHFPTSTESPHEKLMNALADSIQSLFISNDQIPFLRICRPFLRKSPNIIHNAIDNNNTDILLKFLPIANTHILQQRNQLDETVLLHMIRLNRIDMIKILLENKNLDTCLFDVDGQTNNIFHIIALNSNSLELIELLIKYFDNKKINIQEKFDHFNKDHLTPLQLSIMKNNFLITKYFLNYFNKDIHETKNLTGDNLIHLAVKYADLTMIKYLIEQGELFGQGKQSNLKMTPSELAKSLKREDIIQYFNQIYPQQEIDDEDDDDDD